MEHSNNLPSMSPSSCAHCNSVLLEVEDFPLVPNSLFRTSYFPDSSKVSSIEQFISSNEEAVRVQEAKIAHMKKSIEQHRSLISPIRRLPEEIHIEILRHAITADDDHNDDTFGGIDMASKHGIWSIREVCARWQNIVDNTPTFWSTFYYDHDYTNVPDKLRMARTKLCLRLSQSTPLEVSIMPDCEFDSPPYEHFTDDFDEVLHHANRLRALAIDTHVILKIEHWKSKCKSIDFGQLRQLYIKDPCFEDPQLDTVWCSICPFKFFQNATQLEDVELDSVVLDNALELSWLNVKKLRVSPLCCMNEGPEDFIYTFLGHIPHLEILIWEEHPSYIDIPIPEDNVTLPSLKNLQIYGMGDFWSKRALTPLLTSIRISDVDECFHDINHFVSMLQRSGCSLKFVDMILCPKLDAKNTLGVLPVSVEELTLTMRYSVQNSEGIIKSLRYLSQNQPQLLPRLQKLTLRFEVPEGSPYPENIVDVSVDIMKSRSPQLERSAEMVSLSIIKCIVYLSKKLPYTLNLTPIQVAGKELGINVEIEVERRDFYFLGHADRHGSESDPDYDNSDLEYDTDSEFE